MNCEYCNLFHRPYKLFSPCLEATVQLGLFFRFYITCIISLMSGYRDTHHESLDNSPAGPLPWSGLLEHHFHPRRSFMRYREPQLYRMLQRDALR